MNILKKHVILKNSLVIGSLSLALGANMFINNGVISNIYAAAPVIESASQENGKVVYHISSEEDYRRVVAERNESGYNGVVIYLDTDIKFAEPVIPIGNMDHQFIGEFYGQGHILSDVSFDWRYNRGGIFLDVGAGAKIQDLKVKGKEGEQIAFISNVFVYKDCDTECTVEISGCVVEEGSVIKQICSTTSDQCQGMIGFVKLGGKSAGKLIVRDCVFGGMLENSEFDNAGAFIGYMEMMPESGYGIDVQINRCSNIGEAVCVIGSLIKMGEDINIAIDDSEEISDYVRNIYEF